MELIRFKHPKAEHLVVAPLGDIQWSGKRGPSAARLAREHIAEALDLGAYFIGMGDYIDFLSPSNRQRLMGAALYDTAQMTIEDKVRELIDEVYEEILKPTKNRWMGMLEGHHYMELAGITSDMLLAEKLGARFLGTSAYVRMEPCGVTFYACHGTGGGILPAAGINKQYHTSAGLQGADVYLMGHNTKLGGHRLSRPFPDWEKGDLTHHDVLLVNTGGFSKSNIVGHRRGVIPRGDYAEQGMMTPSPLSAPLIHIYPGRKGSRRYRAEI